MKKTFIEYQKETGEITYIRLYDAQFIPDQSPAEGNDILEMDGIRDDIKRSLKSFKIKDKKIVWAYGDTPIQGEEEIKRDCP